MAPKNKEGRWLPVCCGGECGFVFWDNAKPCVTALIFNQKKELLMTVRGIEPEKGKLDLPGGFLHGEELPEEGLKRELKEELGVRVKAGKYIGSAVDNYFYQGIEEKALIIGMEAEILKGEPKANDKKEIAGVEWVDAKNLETGSLAFNNNERFLKMVGFYNL